MVRCNRGQVSIIGDTERRTCEVHGCVCMYVLAGVSDDTRACVVPFLSTQPAAVLCHLKPGDNFLKFIRWVPVYFANIYMYIYISMTTWKEAAFTTDVYSHMYMIRLVSHYVHVHINTYRFGHVRTLCPYSPHSPHCFARPVRAAEMRMGRSVVRSIFFLVRLAFSLASSGHWFLCFMPFILDPTFARHSAFFGLGARPRFSEAVCEG